MRFALAPALPSAWTTVPGSNTDTRIKRYKSVDYRSPFLGALRLAQFSWPLVLAARPETAGQQSAECEEGGGRCPAGELGSIRKCGGEEFWASLTDVPGTSRDVNKHVADSSRSAAAE